MDLTTFSQTMDIDVDFDGNQSCQPTKMISMFANNQHTFNFEDTEVTFEFSRYIQQLVNDMEDAKNRIDGGDTREVKNLLNSLIDKVQMDMSVLNQSINSSLNATIANRTKVSSNESNNTALNNTILSNTTMNNTAQVSNSKTETSILGLLADLFSSKELKSPIETISKLNVLSKTLNNVSSLANLSMNTTINNTTVNERSILRSIIEESTDNKENSKSNETFQDSINLGIHEATFINNSVCNPLMELISAVEKKIDIEKIEDELRSKYVGELKEKDDLIIEIKKNLQNLKENLEAKTNQYDSALEQLERAKKENEVLDEIISDEKRKLQEKQGTVEELNERISEGMNEILKLKEEKIQLNKEVNRLSVMEKQNQSLNEQVNDLMAKLNNMFELEKKITNLNVECTEKQTKIDTISYQLQTKCESNERLSKEKNDLEKKIFKLNAELSENQSKIEIINFELKSNQELNERLSKERQELMKKLDNLIKNDSDKASNIVELETKITNLNAQLSLQNDKCDFLNAKLKDTSALKSQLEKDRKDVCWQINELLKNPDVDFEDLKTFLIRVEEKINNVDLKKPKGAAFVKSLSLTSQTAK